MKSLEYVLFSSKSDEHLAIIAAASARVIVLSGLNVPSSYPEIYALLPPFPVLSLIILNESAGALYVKLLLAFVNSISFGTIAFLLSRLFSKFVSPDITVVFAIFDVTVSPDTFIPIFTSLSIVLTTLTITSPVSSSYTLDEYTGPYSLGFLYEHINSSFKYALISSSVTSTVTSYHSLSFICTLPTYDCSATLPEEELTPFTMCCTFAVVLPQPPILTL